MTSHRRASRLPAARVAALLVFAVLGCVLGMHGLQPPGAGPVRCAASAPHLTLGSPAPDEGAHAGERHEGGSGDSEHARQPCEAAPGPNAVPVLPAPAPVPPRVPPPSGPSSPGTETAGERSPPSLAQLQILRV
ncbi:MULTISPECIES: DUF6153 family protein [unclassified Streptomyces]|uniref:DUF6153 family protein n=1 Tax=unclassified Streptomyces TaxID=2593676 RepID=UPI0022B711FE|nr:MULTISPECIES: DUF6153 family protein [unclassified Streptomyces]MCZ7415713.1 DUF6153 family protein [Streptomyces sp. WMMC897]MCZ7434476.1 DUF6153 family protein [Streptomyces sp. WMMC1477]